MWTNKNKLRTLLHFKDTIPRKYLSKVVYEATCSGCGGTYIGHTARYLDERIHEHQIGKPKSNVFEHVSSCKPNVTMFYRFIEKFNDSKDLFIAENISIKLKKPIINVQRGPKLCCL